MSVHQSWNSRFKFDLYADIPCFKCNRRIGQSIVTRMYSIRHTIRQRSVNSFLFGINFYNHENERPWMWCDPSLYWCYQHQTPDRGKTCHQALTPALICFSSTETVWTSCIWLDFIQMQKKELLRLTSWHWNQIIFVIWWPILRLPSSPQAGSDGGEGTNCRPLRTRPRAAPDNSFTASIKQIGAQRGERGPGPDWPTVLT